MTDFDNQTDASEQFEDLLQYLTGRTEREWISRVQELIVMFTEAREDGNNVTDTGEVMQVLSGEIACLCSDLNAQGYDGNMRCAAVSALIWAAWFIRVKRSKVSDTRRDLVERQRAYQELIRYQLTMTRIIADVASDALSFDQPERRFDDLVGAS